MVSARVLHPVVLSEFCKMSASPAVSRNLTCGRQLDRIKRNLFGSAQTTTLMESKTSLFTSELEHHQDVATKKWGFDFRADRPLGANGSFIWERVSSQESHFAPQMYTLTRAAHVRPDYTSNQMDGLLMNERADRENSINTSLDSNTDTEYDSQDESLSLVASTSAAAALTAASYTLSSFSAATSNSSSQQRKRQLKITEFMKERKRLAQAPKKISPAKRMRTSSGSSSNTNSSSSSSLGAHLGCLLKRPRHN